MAEIRWTPQASDDLEAIAEFISLDSPHYASIFVMDVFNAVDQLEICPDSGRIVPELNEKSIREIILGNYRIVYRIRYAIVEILTVYHSARLLNPDGF
jgi:addiction module RelE/StbE family toxin